VKDEVKNAAFTASKFRVSVEGCIGWTKVEMLIVPMEKGSTMMMSWQ
jgi:hypothetical protein